MENQIYIVERKHLANNVGSGELPVLSTPSLLSFIENKCMLEIKKSLNDDETSVGVKVNLKQLNPSLEFDEIKCNIKSKSNNDKKWIFEVEISCDNKIIGIAEHTRYIVNKTQFMNNR